MNENYKKRARADDESFVQNKPQCIPGRAPNFSSPAQTSDGSKFGTGKETNAHRIEIRMKQIQYGKNTLGYDNYLAAVPKNKRGKYAEHPRTPDIYEEISKRAFDGKVKAWRRQLHRWDNMEDIEGMKTSKSVMLKELATDKKVKEDQTQTTTESDSKDDINCFTIAEEIVEDEYVEENFDDLDVL